MFLEIVTLTGDVGDEIATIGQSDLGDLTLGRIGFLRLDGAHSDTGTRQLGGTAKVGSGRAKLFDLAVTTKKLMESGHGF